LVVVAVCDPGANRVAVQRSGDEPLVEGMLVVIARLADGMKPLGEVGAGRCDL
jgi:hypothetical protein